MGWRYWAWESWCGCDGLDWIDFQCIYFQAEYQQCTYINFSRHDHSYLSTGSHETEPSQPLSRTKDLEHHPHLPDTTGASKHLQPYELGATTRNHVPVPRPPFAPDDPSAEPNPSHPPPSLPSFRPSFLPSFIHPPSSHPTTKKELRGDLPLRVHLGAELVRPLKLPKNINRQWPLKSPDSSLGNLKQGPFCQSPLAVRSEMGRVCF